MATNAGYDFAAKQGDTQPVWNDTLTYSDGSVANLTGASVMFVMRSMTSSTVTTNAAATIVSPTAGTVSYTPTATDTANFGNYQGAWVVTFSGGAIQTWPTDGYLDIWIQPNLTSSSTQYLVSLDDLKDQLNIPGNDRTRDQKLIRWITAARPVIEAITGPIIPTHYDEWYDGGGFAIQLRHRPLITLEAVSMYLGPVEYAMSIVTQPQAGSIFSVMQDGSRRIVRRGPGGSQLPFPDGKQTVHVLYTAGLTSIPENIRIATMMMIQEHWVDTQSPGWGDHGREHEPAAHIPPPYLVSDRVREWLEPNRRHPAVY